MSPVTKANGADELAHGRGVAAASARVSDVGAVLGTLPCSCGRHRCHYNGRSNIAGDQGEGQVCLPALTGTDAYKANAMTAGNQAMRQIWLHAARALGSSGEGLSPRGRIESQL